MSIYRDTNATVSFEHPFQGPLDAAVYRNGVKISEVLGVTSSANRFELPLTYRETEFDGDLEIRWSGIDAAVDPPVPFSRAQTVEVRTPLAMPSQLRTLFSNSNWSDIELRELENNVRLVIEAYTGQKFGYEVGPKYVVGTGEKRIALPARLARLDSITGGHFAYYTVSNDGWYLNIANKNYLSIKEMPPEDYIDNVQLVSGVIHVPDSYWSKFRSGVEYEIVGEWGYRSVPEDVTEAALLLANDFGSGENLYRDRYLEAIKAGDWNLVFSQAAYRGTGNARADNLLAKYKRQGMVVI